ncbi:hypothetical protein [Spirosoma jeollabukense]
MNELIKSADQASIKTYFETVLQLARQGSEFPIDLDEVWPLVYADKTKAVRAMRRNFIESVDYQSLSRSGAQKAGRGGQNEIRYQLSLSCFEFFIARKVREVFEVYRHIFHQVAAQSEELTQSRILDYEDRISRLERSLNGLLEREQHHLELPPQVPARPQAIDTLRSQVVQLLQQSAESKNIAYYKAWNQLYDQLHVVYGFNVRMQRKTEYENLLDVAERHGQLERLYAILRNEQSRKL